MKERLAAIDVSSIEELQRIKTEQDVILQRLEMMEEKRSAVSEEVFGRVHLDYEGQMTDLEEQAGPLKEQARGQYAELKVVLEEIEAAVNTAEMDSEELQLRHDLGEFSDEDFAEHQEEHEDRVAEHRSDLEEAQALRERFLSAFHSEDELEDGSPADPGEEVQEEEQEVFEDEDDPGVPGLPAGPPPIPGNDDQVFGDSEPEAEIEPESELAEEVEEAAPMAMEAEEISDQTVSMPLPSPVPEDATMILKWPALLLQTEKGDFEERPVVGASSILGSDPECEITISGSKVGQRHSEIIMTENGHMVRNLDETVGTLVNGVEITEWNLSDGDSIQIGEVILVFKEA
jgi:hypothetical protein